MENIKMDLRSYEESLVGGLMEKEDVEREMAEIKAAKVGTIKANRWEKISDDEIIVFMC